MQRPYVDLFIAPNLFIIQGFGKGVHQMEMTSLRLLHRSMLSIGSDMQQFLVRSGAASFDCLFSTRDTPFVLTLTARGKVRGFFRFDVLSGYRIRDYFGEGRYFEVQIKSGENWNNQRGLSRAAVSANPDRIFLIYNTVEDEVRYFTGRQILDEAEWQKSIDYTISQIRLPKRMLEKYQAHNWVGFVAYLMS
nr:hypothetical protein [Pseudomonas syringae]